jgi:hypothetical protein
MSAPADPRLLDFARALARANAARDIAALRAAPAAAEENARAHRHLRPLQQR